MKTTGTNNNESAPPMALLTEINNVFAKVEQQGVRLTLTIVLVTFTLYLTGWVEAFMAPQKLAGVIGVSVGSFVREHHAPTGWQWLGMLGYSDMMSLGGLVLMVGVIFMAYVLLLPILIRRRAYLYLVLAVIQLLLFTIAGLGGPGGH